MKKIVSVVTAWLLMATFLNTGCFTALAESTTKYWEPIPHPQDATAYFNGQNQIVDSVYELYDEKTNLLHIWVDSDYYEVTGWEFPLLTEGKDYEIADESDQNIWLLLLTHDGIPYINVLVDDLEGVRKAQLSAMHADSDSQSEEKTEERSAKRPSRLETNTQKDKQTKTDQKESESAITRSELEPAQTEQSSIEPASSQTLKLENQNIPVLPIALICAFVLFAAVLGIVLYKKHKNNSIS